jgi:hypothetical protein
MTHDFEWPPRSLDTWRGLCYVCVAVALTSNESLGRLGVPRRCNVEALNG